MENKEMTLIPESGHAADEQSVSKVSEKKLVPQEVCDTKNFSVGQTAELREFGENVAQREETKRVLRMEGGRHKMIFGLNADEYRDAKGNWREADNTLELQAESKDADFAGYENKSNSFKVRIAENANSKTLLYLRYGESSVRFGLKDRCRTKAGKLASRKGRLSNYENKCKALLHGNETRRCGEVDFKDVFAGSDLKYQVEGDRIKESIVIKEKQASYKYEFCIETEKAELREEESGAIGIYNGATKIFSIPEAFMEDASGDASSAVRYELRSEGEGHYHIAIIADAEWLNQEGRAFPVVLDPSLIKENQYLTCRCVGRNGTAYTSSESPLRVGKVGDWVYRTYVNFDFGSIDGYDISNAMLLLTLSKSGSGNYYVAKSTQSSSSTTSFTSQTAACDIFTFSESEDGQHIATADITRILRDWQNGSVNSGITIYGNEVAGQSITIQDVQLSVTCQSKRAKASKSFQKNDVRRAGSSAVDLFTGRLLFEHKDFELSSEVMPINISHEYNSDYYDEEVDNNMKIGKGWRLNLQQSYRQETYSEYQVPASGNTANVYVYTDGNGIEREITYKKYYLETRKTFYPGDYDGRTTKRYDDSGNYGEFSSDEGLRLDTNNHKIVDKSGVETYFTWDSNLNRYKLWRVSASGKALIPSYSYNQISRVSDAAGRSAVLQYNSQNYLTKITCAGKTISFEYSNGYLTKITYPDNTYTKFEYSGGRLAKVIDRSGFELDYTYTNGKVTCVQEQIANQTIGSSVVAKSSLMSGDSWDIKYLHALQTQVKNRNGLCMEYVFDVDGNTVTMYEDDRTSAADNKIAICGKAIHKNTYITELKETLDSEDLYKTKVESVEATLYKAPNKLTAIENWSANWTRSGTEGPSTACYVEGGKSYKVNGSLTQEKSLKTTITVYSQDVGIFLFGCWAKAENSLASIDKVYTGSSGRYFGLKVTFHYATGSGEHVYFASFDPYNSDWQLAAIAVKMSLDNVSHVDVEVLYNCNQGTVYFDHAFAAKTDGGVTYMYDNNYSETWYQNYYVTTLFDDAMNDVRNIFSRFMGLSYVTENSFDANNRPLVTQNYRGVQTVRTYNNFGALLSVQTNAGSLKMYESRSYNTDSNPGNYLVESVNSDGSQTKFAYDYTDGELTSSTMPNGQKVNYTYDSMGQLKAISAVVNGLTNKNEITYKFGYITKLKHGNTTYDFTYDGYGRIKTVKAGGVTILTNTYTDFGKNLGGVTGAVSSVTSVDAMDNTVTTYTDKYGKVIATRQNNDLNENEYDAADNLIKHVDSDNNIEYNYEYNEQGDVTKYYEGDSESSAHVRVYNTYDYYNRPLKSTYNVNGKNYSYECEYTEYPDEMLDGFTTPLGEVTYTRDALTRLTQKTVAAKNKTFTETYAYLANLSNSNYTTQLVRELNFNSGVGGVKTLSYTYDANGNIKTVKEGSSEVASYEYDGLNRLTRENIAGEKTVVYTYDAGGNLKTKKEYAYTKSATLGTVKDTFNYTYASGTWGDRLTKYDVGSIQYNEAGYPTMYRGHVLSWEKGNLQYFDNTDFIYNDSGIRIAKGSTDYFVKGNQILAEKRGSTVIHYYYDENGVAGFEYAGQQYYYRKNLQGDIIGIYDSCGNLLGEYKYDAWGNILSQGGSNILTINPFRYRGYYYDEETGLYYLNSRYYDPETGRFISPDDVGVLDETFTQLNGLNLYAYCYNNPVMMTDPDGAFALTWWQKLLIGLAFITLGAIATALSGGSFAAAFVCGLSVAMKSAVTGAIVGAVMGGLTSAFSGGNVLEGTASGLMNGLFDGFMWGGITAGVSNVVKPGSFCFIAGTKVLTDSGHKNIEDIEVGDYVLAYDEETGVTAYKPVLHLFRNTTKEWCTVSIRGAEGELYEITSTPGHKYFIPGNRVRKDSRAPEHASYASLSEKWVSACDLKHGDKVLLSDGTLCEVEGVSCKKLSELETTYNLEVADFHTYYVSDACVLVHNAGCGTGSYDIEFKSGKHYVGKGSVKRMNQSARRIATKYKDEVVSKVWTSSKNSQMAFVDEHMKMAKYEFAFGEKLYNKIISPGAKIFELML